MVGVDARGIGFGVWGLAKVFSFKTGMLSHVLVCRNCCIEGLGISKKIVIGFMD